MKKLVKFQELVALAGYANRVSEMLNVFRDASLCKYRRNVVTSHQTRGTNVSLSSCRGSVLEFHDGTPIIKGIVRESLDGGISLSDVPIVTPNCEVIVPSLTLDVSKKTFVLSLENYTRCELHERFAIFIRKLKRNGHLIDN